MRSRRQDIRHFLKFFDRRFACSRRRSNQCTAYEQVGMTRVSSRRIRPSAATVPVRVPARAGTRSQSGSGPPCPLPPVGRPPPPAARRCPSPGSDRSSCRSTNIPLYLKCSLTSSLVCAYIEKWPAIRPAVCFPKLRSDPRSPCPLYSPLFTGNPPFLRPGIQKSGEQLLRMVHRRPGIVGHLRSLCRGHELGVKQKARSANRLQALTWWWTLTDLNR